MKFKNLHEDIITIDTKEGRKVARPGEFVELDETTYKMVKDIYTKLELVKEQPVVEQPVVEQPVVEKPKAVKNVNKKSK